MAVKGGVRYNKGKNRLSLIPVGVLWELGKVYTRGAEKYAPRNWEKGLPYSETLDAALRHLYKFAAGYRIDDEMGTHHLANAMWGIVALLHMELNHEAYQGCDDLPRYFDVPNESAGVSGEAAGGGEVALGPSTVSHAAGSCCAGGQCRCDKVGGAE